MTVLTGQDIGRANLATRAVLERELDGLPFEQWVMLNLFATNGFGETELIHGVSGGLQIGTDNARSLLTGLIERGLVGRGEDLVLTPPGEATFRRVSAAITGIVDTLYGGIPDDDLVVTKRVLATVTERANRALKAR